MAYYPAATVLGPAKPSAAPLLEKPTQDEIFADLDDLEEGPSSIYESIKSAFREIHNTKNTPHYTYSASIDGNQSEVELAWTSDTVVASCGGVTLNQWTFGFEEQDIQWACWGWLEQPGGLVEVVPSTGRDLSLTSSLRRMKLIRPTFGPFAESFYSRRELEPSTRCHGVFIFLRSIARIFLTNGRDYTIHLPFLVRKAWPLFPVGVLVQRVLSKEEEIESLSTKNEVLPTIYSLSDPLSEFRVVCTASTISGGLTPQEPASIPSVTEPPPSILPSDKIIWTSEGEEAHEQIFITVDIRGRFFRIWRYAHVIPEDEELLPDLDSNPSTQVNPPVPPPRRGHNRAVSGSLVDLPVPDSGYTLEDSQGTQPTLVSTLSATSTMASGNSQGWSSTHERADSGTRNELSATLDRMALGSQPNDNINNPESAADQARMKPAYWAHELFSDSIPDADMKNPSKITAAIFDSRSDLKSARCLLALSFPETQIVSIYNLTREDDGLQIAPLRKYPAISIAPLNALRENVQDLLLIQPDNTLKLVIGPLTDLPIDLNLPEHDAETEATMVIDQDNSFGSVIDRGKIVGLRDAIRHHVTVVMEGGAAWRVALDYAPRDELTKICMESMACVLPDRVYFSVFLSFLQYHRHVQLDEFEAFKKAVLDCCHIVAQEPESATPRDDPFTQFLKSNTMKELHQDLVASAFLALPELPKTTPGTPHQFPPMPHHHKSLFKLILSCFHLLFEDFKLSIKRRQFVEPLCTLVAQLAAVFRPEWLDFYARTCPDLAFAWETPRRYERVEEDMPVVGPSIYSHLYARLTSSERSWPSVATVMVHKDSLPMCQNDPWRRTRRIDQVYSCFTDSSKKDFRSRAELAVETMVALDFTLEELDDVPYGVAIPIRECLRACQMSPPSEWPLAAYELVGRQDLAEMAKAPTFDVEDEEPGLAEKPIFEEEKKSISEIVDAYNEAIEGNTNKIVNEMELGKLTKIRFATDRRLDEVARILQASTIQAVKMEEKPMSELDLTKEQQLATHRIGERTMALAMGRALFTFGTVMNVTNDTYRVPKLEFSVRLLPANVVITLEPGKISQDSLNWAEFHNGVAAGLRIAPSSNPIASSWITFNKPSELSPEHAGFLYGLGLTGHLKSMLTWHTFTYLTPKHDLTSIAVLLGLAAAYRGSGNRHVRKLLAVHTPALLPKSSMELNIPLLTQAAGMAGIGLLYLGTGHRRMAEVCLGEMFKKDSSSISSTANETKEAYVVSAALSFGMITLARGFVADNAADRDFVSRLKTLIHGVGGNGTDAPFDVNATSPAACIALGLMFLRTNRGDIAEIMTLPDSLTGLNRLPPHFLFYRALGRDLIMWKDISPTLSWIMGHFPPDVKKTMESRSTGARIDIAYELAYYYTVAGACFAIGLRFAGTAKEEAYLTLMHFYDLYSRLTWTPAGGGYDFRIRRSAVREGLNMISLGLGLIMAGTGEIHCLRRFRFSHGQVQIGSRYGSHVANVMSIGMLFMGGGHFTLGNSDAAIACLVAACFPPFPVISCDNRCHLQALRHLWVLAIEPRCLIARDVSTKEVVYLPIKVQIQESDGLIRNTQLISPTLIPNLSRLMAIKVDTPRYWPFILDLAKIQRHRDRIIQDQTLWVKRKTGFLGYSEDPKGSRSIFIRAGASSGDAVMLEFPTPRKEQNGPSKDFKDFVSSFSIEPEHLAFADRFCRMEENEGKSESTKVFEAFAHAAFLECLTLDKAELFPAHMEVHLLRSTQPEQTASFNMRLDNLVFAAGFYTTVYEKRFNIKHGHTDGVERVPLMRPAFLLAALLTLDQSISSYRSTPSFLAALASYCAGERRPIPLLDRRRLATYLVRDNVPPSDLLIQLRNLSKKAYEDVAKNGLPAAMRGVVRNLLHETAVNACKPSANKWSMRSLDEVLSLWGET